MQFKQVHLCTAGQAVAGLGWLAGQALHSPDIKHALTGPSGREKKEGKKEGRWARLQKKEKERCLFFSLTKAKDLFDIKTFQI